MNVGLGLIVVGLCNFLFYLF